MPLSVVPATTELRTITAGDLFLAGGASCREEGVIPGGAVNGWEAVDDPRDVCIEKDRIVRGRWTSKQRRQIMA